MLRDHQRYYGMCIEAIGRERFRLTNELTAAQQRPNDQR
jgi:hypothetical protein